MNELLKASAEELDSVSEELTEFLESMSEELDGLEANGSTEEYDNCLKTYNELENIISDIDKSATALEELTDGDE